MAFKVCIAWAISAVALLVSSALASPSHKGAPQQILPSTNVANEEGAVEGPSDGEAGEEEEIED